MTKKAKHMPDAITFDGVKAYGSAGGSTRRLNITTQIEGSSDTVEQARALIEAAPDLLASAKIVYKGWPNLGEPMSEETSAGFAALGTAIHNAECGS